MLGQMTDAERETFEEHYFNCRFCVEDVKEIDLMSRIAPQQPNPQPVRKNVIPGPFGWIPKTAAASLIFGLLGTGAGYVIAEMRNRPPKEPVTQIAEVPYVPDAPLKSEERTVAAATRLPAGRRIILYLEIAHDPQYTQYRWELRADKAKSLASGALTPEQTNEPIPLLLGPLPAGSYELVIEGVRKDGNRSQITIHPLVVGGS